MTNRADGASEPLADALALLADGLTAVAAIPAWQLSGADVGSALVALERAGRAVTAQATRLAGEADDRGLPEHSGLGSLAGWLRSLTPTLPPREAAALARRAERLYTAPVAAGLAPTREAMLAGALRAEQVDVITTTIQALSPPAVSAEVVDASTLSEAQEFLLDEARSFDGPRLRVLANRLRDRLDPDADRRLADDEQARERARCLTLASEASGMFFVHGQLTPEAGAALTAAIDAASAPRPSSDGTPDPRTAAQRRHDGLEQLARSALAGGRVPSSHGSPARVVVRVGIDTLTAALDQATARDAVTGLQPAQLDGGPPLSNAALARVACDAELVTVLTDQRGNPLDVGRTQYAFTAAQRAAIAERDQGCTWPGCSMPSQWSDIHHVTWFSRGGSTAVDNAATLCGRHHAHVHRQDVAGRLRDGHVVWDAGPASPQASQAGSGPPPADSTTRATRALDHLIRRWLVRRRQ